MSEEFWESVTAANSATTPTVQSDSTPSLTRREARERQLQAEAAEQPTRRERNSRTSRKTSRPASRKATRSASRSASRKASYGRPPARPATARPAAARTTGASVRAAVAKLMSLGAMVGVAGMLVATSVPANAFIPAPSEATVAQLQAAPAQVDTDSIQFVAVKAASSDAVAHVSERDAYTVVSLADQLRKQYGNRTYSFTNNPNGTIQWPFATSVPISSGFGDRVACSYCSSNHLGVDFVPGNGAPIQAIADGVVREVNAGGGAYGVNIIIDHEINGKKVTSLYAHMMWGSPAVAAGQAVTVGQYLGDVGSTGASTGPHLHLEIHVEGTPVDPFAWLKANAN